MIATIVIGGSVALGVAFSAAWLVLPGLRREIERPKHWFADQARQYDRACHELSAQRAAASDESD